MIRLTRVATAITAPARTTPPVRAVFIPATSSTGACWVAAGSRCWSDDRSVSGLRRRSGSDVSGRPSVRPGAPCCAGSVRIGRWDDVPQVRWIARRPVGRRSPVRSIAPPVKPGGGVGLSAEPLDDPQRHHQHQHPAGDDDDDHRQRPVGGGLDGQLHRRPPGRAVGADQLRRRPGTARTGRPRPGSSPVATGRRGRPARSGSVTVSPTRSPPVICTRTGTSYGRLFCTVSTSGDVDEASV